MTMEQIIQQIRERWDSITDQSIGEAQNAIAALLEALDEARLEVKAFELTDRAWKTEVDAQAQRIGELEEALNKINLGRHGELNSVQMALIAWTAISAGKKEKKP